jgi:dihydrofolate reductase
MNASEGATSRRICYQVAASLDGYIAGPQGEADWIVPEPSFDFAALFARFDTFLMGRRTYEAAQRMGGPEMDGRTLVFSTTLRAKDHPKVEVVSHGVEERLRVLRAESGKDIWLFGGGQLFRSLLAIGQVDAVEIALVPIMLGDGIPLLAPADRPQGLRLVREQAYPSGIVLLEYAIERQRAAHA